MHQGASQAFFDPKAAKDYGGFADQQAVGRLRRMRKSADKFGLRTNLGDTQILVLVGTATYLATLCIHNFGLFRHSQAVVNSTLTALAVCALLAVNWGHRLFYLALSCCTALAVISGAVAGRLCYSNFGYYSYQLSNLRSYENVVPSESTAVVSDAGRITFAAEARLDQSRAVGFAAEDGHMYCVAPVMSGIDRSDTKVAFWAAGRDCCKLNGAFECDEAKNSKARGGAVMLDGPGGVFDQTSHEHYDDARRKSQAMYDLTIPSSIMYLRWATPEQLLGLTWSYNNKAGMFICTSTACYLGIACALAWLMARGQQKAFVPEV